MWATRFIAAAQMNTDSGGLGMSKLVPSQLTAGIVCAAITFVPVLGADAARAPARIPDFPRAANICAEDTANFFDHDIEPLPTAARPDF